MKILANKGLKQEYQNVPVKTKINTNIILNNSK